MVNVWMGSTMLGLSTLRPFGGTSDSLSVWCPKLDSDSLLRWLLRKCAFSTPSEGFQFHFNNDGKTLRGSKLREVWVRDMIHVFKVHCVQITNPQESKIPMGSKRVSSERRQGEADCIQDRVYHRSADERSQQGYGRFLLVPLHPAFQLENHLHRNLLLSKAEPPSLDICKSKSDSQWSGKVSEMELLRGCLCWGSHSKIPGFGQLEQQKWNLSLSCGL